MIYSKNPWTNQFQLILSGAICRAKVADKARDKVEAKVKDNHSSQFQLVLSSYKKRLKKPYKGDILNKYIKICILKKEVLS